MQTFSDLFLSFKAGLSNIFIVNGGGGILGGLGVAINGNGAGAAAANASGEGFLGLGCLCNAYLGNGGLLGGVFGGSKLLIVLAWKKRCSLFFTFSLWRWIWMYW